MSRDDYSPVVKFEEQEKANKSALRVIRRSVAEAGSCSFCSSEHRWVWEVSGTKSVFVRFCDHCAETLRMEI